MSEIRTNMDMRKKGLLIKLKVRIQGPEYQYIARSGAVHAPVFMLSNKANLRLY